MTPAAQTSLALADLALADLDPTSPGEPAINISIFLAFVAVTLFIVIKGGGGAKHSSGEEFFAGGRSFSGAQNGLAISGDYLSAASFLGIVGAIATAGYDGFLYSIGFLVAWLVALLLVAELMRNTGKFTMADVLAFRLRPRPIRVAAAITTLAVTFFYLLAQMAGAGGLVSLLLGITQSSMQSVVIAVVGVLMIIYVLIGGMKGTTWVQMIKAVLLIAGAAVTTIWVLAINGFSLSELLGRVVENTGAFMEAGGHAKDAMLNPGLKYGGSNWAKIDFISLGLALVLGTAGLPHVLMRFYTVPSAKEARKSVVWSIFLIGLFYVFTLVLGYAAAYMFPPGTWLKGSGVPGGSNAAAPVVAAALGGPWMLGIMAAVAFATILAVVAGLAITAATSFAHDIYTNVIKQGRVAPGAEVRVAKATVVVIGLIAIVGGIAAKDQNIAFLVSLAFAVAASANLPTIVFSLYWKRFSTNGALWSMYGGLISALVIITFSKVVSGSPTAMLPEADFAFIPLSNPGIVSIPLGFLLAVAGTVLTKSEDDPAREAEMDVRALTGVGAEKAIDH
ncbi:MAG: cation acetate symporter [Bifidobacteriaceae bacterium]|jgi:cation/acetate symporter|nr:cation acetate symporter [Bifidobacteriaceae bacterium]